MAEPEIIDQRLAADMKSYRVTVERYKHEITSYYLETMSQPKPSDPGFSTEDIEYYSKTTAKYKRSIVSLEARAAKLLLDIQTQPDAAEKTKLKKVYKYYQKTIARLERECLCMDANSALRPKDRLSSQKYMEKVYFGRRLAKEKRRFQRLHEKHEKEARLEYEYWSELYGWSRTPDSVKFNTK